MAACILNLDEEPREISFDWGHVQGLPWAKWQIRDLWEKKDVGTTAEKFSRKIDSHDVALLRLSRGDGN